MGQYFALKPVLDDLGVATFAALIGSDPEIRQHSSVPALLPYEDDLTLLEVPRRPHQGARIKMCWFNCREYAQKNPGSEVVFGWQIERMKDDNGRVGIGAFHHAVIRHNNVLVDITPYAEGNEEPTLLFLPDSRVPYDFQGGRTPVSLFWSLAPHMEPFWTGDTAYPNENRLPGYQLGKPPDQAMQPHKQGRAD